MTKIFGLLTIVAGAVAFFAEDRVIDGIAKAFAGVFFIMVFMVKLADYWTTERPETTHDHGGLMGKGGGHGHH